MTASARPTATALAAAVCIALFACTVTPSPTPAPPPAMPSPTLAPTLVPTLQPIPTETPRPTTRAATPTPVPNEGQLLDEKTGIGFVLPEGWKKTERAGNLSLDSGDGVIVLLFGESAAASFEASVDAFKTSLRSSEVKPLGPLTVGQGIPAKGADISSEDRRSVYRYIGVSRPGRSYALVAVGSPRALNDNARKLDGLLRSLQFSNLIFGVPRDQALLQYGGSPDPESLDPALAAGSADDYVGHLYSGLVRLSPQLSIEPDLAETWRAAQDGSVYTFTLRADARFADGRPLTAKDVRYSWERAGDPALDSETFLVYLGDILGAGERRAGKTNTLRGLRVLDERTLEVTLDGPKAYFIAKLTYPTGFVVDRHAVEAGGERWMFKPNASGPYALRSYKEDEHIVFERNPNYHHPADLPYAVYNARLGGSALSVYQADGLDIVHITDKDAERLRSSKDPLANELQSTASLCTSLLQFDVFKPPLDDINLRQALARSIDVNALSARFDQQDNLRAPTVLPPAMAGHRDLPDRFAFNPAEARAWLAKSKYAAAVPVITINFAGVGDRPNPYIGALADMWREHLGLRFEFQKLDGRNFSRAAREQRGNLVSYGWCADYPDPENFLDVLYHSDSIKNVAGYRNPAFDALIEQARAEVLPQARISLYQRAEDLLLDDVPMILLTHGVQHALVKPRVKGYLLTPMGAPYVHRIRLEPPP